MSYQIIDGIKCYNPELIESYDNFPEYGFSDNLSDLKINFWDRSRYRLFKKIIAQESKSLQKVKLLEVGCNNGIFIKMLGNLNKFQITGSEIYLKGLLIAKKHIPNVEFIQLDITTPVLKDNSYDLITAFDVLEHIERDDLAIANIFNMLKPRGKFIVSVPQHKFMYSDFDKFLNHQRRYTRQELVQKLIASGFKINYSSSFVFFLFPLMLISRLKDSMLSSNATKSLTNEEFNQKLSLPDPLDRLFNFLMKIDEFFIKIRISLPFGGTLLVIAEK